MTPALARPVDLIAERYAARTPGSRALHARARETMPLGVSANLKMFAPYPIYLDRAEGARAWDVDGNEYLDVSFGAGPHLFGHRHPAIERAVRAQMDRLIQHFVPDRNEVELAERLRRRYPHLQRLRFANTGSEAMRGCVRVARAVTRRPLIAKIEGHYHGADDILLVSGKSVSIAGSAERPAAVPDSPGLAPGTTEGVLVLPWNDAAAATRLIDERADELACVLLEPIAYSTGGAIATDPGFAAALREVCTRRGILLVYDEVVTAHRLGPGGAASWLGVQPDLTALGKALGGGFPLAAFGGREDVMEDALGEQASVAGRLVFASGTFSANPIATAAALAVLDVLDEEDPAPRLDALAERLRHGLQNRFDRAGVAAWAVGASSITQVHFAGPRPLTRRDVLAADRQLVERFLLGMVTEGVLWTPVHAALMCSAHDERDVDAVVEAAGRVIPMLSELQ